jgi:DNA-binding NarL/FixJ family response regulator
MTATGSKAPTILLVDDDELIISSLRGLFTLETDYELITRTDPQLALEEVRRTPIDIVITDFLMPQMNGVDFLKQVRTLQPEAVRILLTGFADKENAIRAINQVGLYRYLEKPWDNEDLLLLVRNALQEKSLRWQLTEKVGELDRLVRQHLELTDRHQLLERELEMAARVQRSLLPSEMPKLDGFSFACHYQPSTRLGGDYYDVAERKDSTIVLVSDVSGHGVQASLVSMLIKATFQDVAKYAEDPGRLLTEMNTRLHRFLPTGMYAGATLVWIPAGSATVRITNAGLPYPFISLCCKWRHCRRNMSG